MPSRRSKISGPTRQAVQHIVRSQAPSGGAAGPPGPAGPPTTNASLLTSGTLPDGRFPATLPAVSGANLTNLNAAALATGLIALARIAGLTDAQIDAAAAIAWSKLSKAGSSLADLATRSAADLSSGTIPLARISGLTNAQVAIAAAIDWIKVDKAGSSLVDLAIRSASDLNSGTLNLARMPAITDAQVAAGAAIAWSKIDKTGAVPTDVGASGSASSVEASVDFGTGGSSTMTVTVAASWVLAGTRIVATPFATTADGQTVENYIAALFHCVVSNIVPGVSFDLSVFTHTGAAGIFRFHCIGV